MFTAAMVGCRNTDSTELGSTAANAAPTATGTTPPIPSTRALLDAERVLVGHYQVDKVAMFARLEHAIPKAKRKESMDLLNDASLALVLEPTGRFTITFRGPLDSRSVSQGGTWRVEGQNRLRLTTDVVEGATLGELAVEPSDAGDRLRHRFDGGSYAVLRTETFVVDSPATLTSEVFGGATYKKVP